MSRKMYLLLVMLILFVPLGLLTENPAWGEWDAGFFKETVGYVPEGIEKTALLLKPIIPDYSLPGLNPVLSYYVSAVTGSLLLFLLFYLIHFAYKRIRL